MSRTGEEEFDIVIDEFNDLVKELGYQEELRANLISDVTHELRTPITSLSGQLQGIKDKVFILDEKRINSLLIEINRLDELIDELNDYTKIKSKLHNLEITEINVQSVIKDLVKSLSDDFEKNKIVVNIDVDNIFSIKADKKLVERMIINILINVIKHSGGNRVEISQKNNLILIHDNGIGISKEHQEKVFERFYRVDKSRNRKTGGLGLGLSIVKEIVNAHGWKILISSNEKQGTKFIIDIKPS